MSVAAKALLKNGEKYLVLKQAWTFGMQKWENPGGRCDPGEDPEQGVLREVFEETGITARIERFIHTEAFSSRGDEWVRHLYLCSCDTYDVELSWEHSDYRWLTLEELESLENAPRAQDDIASYKHFLTKTP